MTGSRREPVPFFNTRRNGLTSGNAVSVVSGVVGWLSPIEINEASDPVGSDPCPSARRASQKGFLPISLAKYLALLDWTGRAIRSGKRGSVPLDLKPILVRLGIEPTNWCTLVEKFGKLFKRVAGTSTSLATEADRRGQHYLHAPGVKLMAAG